MSRTRSQPTVDAILDLILEDDEDPDGCWPWLGRLDDDLYGRHGKELAHRVAYEILVGDIPDGYDIDHTCTTRWCCNPRHLEAVTHEENIRRRDEVHRARERGER